MTVKSSRSLKLLRGAAMLLSTWAGLLPERSATQDLDYTGFYTITDAVTTPCIPWGKPLEGKPIRLLVVAPYLGQRETVELAQRLDVELTAVSVYGESLLGSDSPGSTDTETPVAVGTRQQAVLERLHDALKKQYEVVLLARIRWEKLPPEVRYEILRRIKKEALGLVISYPVGVDRWLQKALDRKDEAVARDIASGVPVERLTAFRQFESKEAAARKVVSAATLGKGRIITLTYPSRDRWSRMVMTPNTDFLPGSELAEYEYYQSLVARAVYRAAKRVPTVRVTDTTFPDQPIPPDTSLQGSFTLTASSAKRTKVECELTVRDRFGTVERFKTHPLVVAKRLSLAEIPLGEVKDGLHFADCRVLVNGRVTDWHSTAFQVASPVTLASVTTDRKCYERFEEAQVSVTLSAPAPEGARLQLSIVDSDQRVIAQSAATVGGKTSGMFRVPVENARTLAVEARAQLLAKGNTVLSEVRAPFVVADRRWEDDFASLTWLEVSNSYVEAMEVRQAAKGFGFDCGDLPHVMMIDDPKHTIEARRLAEAGIRVVPYIWSFYPCQPTTDNVRAPCLTDPNYLASLDKALENNTKLFSQFNPMGYTLGDENGLGWGTDFCFSPTCKAAFREWLKHEYGSLDKLNTEWETKFTAWEEATPITRSEAKLPGQQARWVDFRRHMDRVFAGAHARGREVIRKFDPKARVGLDGPSPPDPHSGVDVWQLCKALDLYVPYPNPYHEEAVRSFAPQGALLGVWWGGYIGQKNERTQRFFPWYSLLNGYNSSWWFTLWSYAGALSPDFSVQRYALWAKEELDEIRGGLGKLLLHATRLGDGGALHYSQSSVHAAALAPEFGTPQASGSGAVYAIEDCELQADFVSYEQLESNVLRTGRYRVLILPNSVAMSDGEVAAVRDFVSAGGMVIADVRPALCDEHGKSRGRSALSEVFGADLYSGPAPGATEGALTVDGEFGGHRFRMQESHLRVGPRMEPTAASVLGKLSDKPAVLVNRWGSGLAVLLGFDLGSYPSRRAAGTQQPLRDLLAALLLLSNVRPVTAVTASGKPVLGCEVVRWDDLPARYLAVQRSLWAQDVKEQKVEVVLPATGEVYNARTHRYLGRSSRVSATLESTRPLLFAVYPYRIEGLTLDAPNVIARGAQLPVRLRLNVTGTKLATHVARVEVRDPNGQPVAAFTERLLLKDGRATTRVPVALNAPTGTWVVTATEVVSGLQEVRPFQVQ